MTRVPGRLFEQVHDDPSQGDRGAASVGDGEPVQVGRGEDNVVDLSGDLAIRREQVADIFRVAVKDAGMTAVSLENPEVLGAREVFYQPSQ